MAGSIPCAATAHRQDQRIDLRRILQHFQRDGALTGYDQGIVERMDEGQPFLHTQPRRKMLRFRQHIAMHDHPRPEILRMLNFGKGRAFGHDDGGRDAQSLRMIGDALRMIAGGHGDDAAPPFIVRQAEQAVKRAAFLEGCGELQILEFYPNVAACDARQSMRLQAWGSANLARDRRGGLTNIG
jgi:hypothetical protein